MGLASAKARCAGLAALLLLGACAAPMPAAMPQAPVPMIAPPSAIMPPMPAPAPPPQASTVMPAPMPPALPPPPPTDALSLRAAYGAPDFVRREADSELWRYNGMNCTAFFFLYRDGAAWRLRYSETMPRGRDAPADPACIAGLSARAMS